MMLDDELSMGSSGDALSTHSTHSTPAGVYHRIETQSADVDLGDMRRYVYDLKHATMCSCTLSGVDFLCLW